MVRLVKEFTIPKVLCETFRDTASTEVFSVKNKLVNNCFICVLLRYVMYVRLTHIIKITYLLTYLNKKIKLTVVAVVSSGVGVGGEIYYGRLYYRDYY